MASDRARRGVTGLLLMNLGTPDAPDVGAVRRYLREFLSDPRVVDIHPLGRWLLLNLIILPFRPRRVVPAYQKVWLPAGSPLLVHSLALRDRMRETLGDRWRVELGMRYGRPSIAAAFESLARSDVDAIVAAPLFPQYAASSTGSAVEELYRCAAGRWNLPPIQVLAPFYDSPGFLDAFAATGRPHLDAFRPDHVLFSFHGLPERQIRRSDEAGTHCLQSDGCCDRIAAANRYCYRAQCHATARALAERLGLARERWSISFQSRLGRSPWIRPHMDVVLPELVARGVKRVLVFCPSFVADCLETLEEVAIRGREQFRGAGGEELQLVPSLNANPAWTAALAALARPFQAAAALLPAASAATGDTTAREP